MTGTPLQLTEQQLQKRVLDHARLWRPDDWDTIVATLTTKETA